MVFKKWMHSTIGFDIQIWIFDRAFNFCRLSVRLICKTLATKFRIQKRPKWRERKTKTVLIDSVPKYISSNRKNVITIRLKIRFKICIRKNEFINDFSYIFQSIASIRKSNQLLDFYQTTFFLKIDFNLLEFK